MYPPYSSSRFQNTLKSREFILPNQNPTRLISRHFASAQCHLSPPGTLSGFFGGKAHDQLDYARLPWPINRVMSNGRYVSISKNAVKTIASILALRR